MVLHASNIGPIDENVVRLAVVAASGAAGRECSLGRWRDGLLIASLTCFFYAAFVFPTPLLPVPIGVVHAVYLTIAVAALSLAPVVLIRGHSTLAVAMASGGAVVLSYVLG